MTLVSLPTEADSVAAVALVFPLEALVLFWTPPTGAALVTLPAVVVARRPRPLRPAVLRRVLKMSSKLLSNLFSDIVKRQTLWGRKLGNQAA